MTREAWIDWLKAFGICLVVVGHAELPPQWLVWIYSFHMPLFFAASGYLLPQDAFEQPFQACIGRRLRKILLAYVCFGAIGALHFCLINKFAHFSVPLKESVPAKLASLLFASGATPAALQLHPVVLWFFPALITGTLLCAAAWRIPSPLLRRLVLALLLFLSLRSFQSPLPWHLENAGVAAALIALGHELRIRKHWQQPLAQLPLLVAVLVLLAGSALALLNGRTDFRICQFGYPWLWLPACLAILAGLSLLSMRLPASGTARMLAENSLFIFPLHPLVFWAIDSVCLSFVRGQVAGGAITLAYATLKSLIAILLCLLAAALFQRVRKSPGPGA